MKNKILATLLASALFLTFTGCNTANTTASPASEDSKVSSAVKSEVSSDTANTEFPVTLKHAFGETVIDEKPVNVVTLGWGNQDVVLALGVVPAGASMANFGPVDDKGLLPWTAEGYKGLGVTDPVVFSDTDGFDFEAISAAKPDVILAPYSGMTEDDYKLLSDIAPTVPYKDIPYAITWQEQAATISTALGMKAEGDKLIADVEAKIEAALAANPDIKGKNAAMFWVDASDLSVIYAYTTLDPRGAFLTDLGLNFPASIAGLGDVTKDFSVTISAENVDILKDVDIMITYGDESTVAALQANELYKAIPAVANGAIVTLDTTDDLSASTTPSILSVPATLDRLMEVLAEAAAKASK